MLSLFPLDVLDEIWDLIESVSEGFLTYSWSCLLLGHSGFLLLRYFSNVVSHPRIFQVSQYFSVESSSLSHHSPYS